eukprot:759069-Hanusia_phi.AAC.2
MSTHLGDVPGDGGVVEAVPLVVVGVVDGAEGLGRTALVDPAGAVGDPGMDALVVVPDISTSGHETTKQSF